MASTQKERAGGPSPGPRTDGGVVLGHEVVLAELDGEARLSDTSITDNDELVLELRRGTNSNEARSVVWSFQLQGFQDRRWSNRIKSTREEGLVLVTRLKGRQKAQEQAQKERPNRTRKERKVTSRERRGKRSLSFIPHTNTHPAGSLLDLQVFSARLVTSIFLHRILGQLFLLISPRGILLCLNEVQNRSRRPRCALIQAALLPSSHEPTICHSNSIKPVQCYQNHPSPRKREACGEQKRGDLPGATQN
jgi:hypothetical protein